MRFSEPTVQNLPYESERTIVGDFCDRCLTGPTLDPLSALTEPVHTEPKSRRQQVEDLAGVVKKLAVGCKKPFGSFILTTSASSQKAARLIRETPPLIVSRTWYFRE